MPSDPTARTAAGTVRGVWRDGVAVFRSVPFAAPPDRFAAPRPPASWTGIRDVTVFGPPPPQTGRPTVGDDWLTLAVWTPDPGGAGLPVVVWITGGGYLQCATSDPHLDGATLAAGGVVVVSIHYRTGFEGFAPLDGAPANRGLLDQLAALEWVQADIAAFGGDPGRVTVFGQSAGAGSIAALLAMPGAYGLLSRAVLQSLPATYFSPDLAHDIATEIASEVGRRPRADELAGVPPDDLVRAARTVTNRLPDREDRWGPVAYSSTPFSPVVDGEVLPAAPWSAAAAVPTVDLLVGHVRDEFRLLASPLGPISDDEADALADRIAPAGARGYRAAFPRASAGELRELVLGDWLFRMPAAHLADAAAAGGTRVWMAELSWGFGPQGASHGLDTLLVFGTADVAGEVTAAGPRVAEQGRRLSDLMRAEFLDFVAGADPGWAPWEPGSRATRCYDDEPSVRRYPEVRSLLLWRHHRFGVLGMHVRRP